MPDNSDIDVRSLYFATASMLRVIMHTFARSAGDDLQSKLAAQKQLLGEVLSDLEKSPMDGQTRKGAEALVAAVFTGRRGTQN